MVNRIVIVLLAIFVLGFLSVPHMRVIEARKEGMRLVELLEDYKVEHGTYPDNLQKLGVEITLGSEGAHGIRYRPYSENAEFTLACFGRIPLTFLEVKDVYRSETRDWRTIRD
ncbi:MAG TPA: hypothetical protein V6D20_07135 [Candidatus Obscuribacterales bacterium]